MKAIKDTGFPESTEAANSLEKLEAYLRDQLHGRNCAVSLCMRENGLVLRGRSHSYYVKQLAQHFLMCRTTLLFWPMKLRSPDRRKRSSVERIQPGAAERLHAMHPVIHRMERASPADTQGGHELEQVMEASRTSFSHCQVCQRQLEHTALFCPKCGTSACSWECYVKHLNSHAQEHQPAAADVVATRQQRS